ncbi:hypothetical protein K503DRAFT_786108 [Rhizopogon vinicolor AM-OR11-026]|uniref:Uncharacterized protein n=1 Tax=Rhizopogon vinicolor AM-OR11-026 TaxID=1314800 RepID=A0A1B7MN00_9AGAM|nr:hypothetical protein K503DRAFT_786108 [Rhizopogon vinicolor AM-OR11-026]
MNVVHIARPLCCGVIFSHGLAAGTYPNIGRSYKSCSVASATAQELILRSSPPLLSETGRRPQTATREYFAAANRTKFSEDKYRLNFRVLAAGAPLPHHRTEQQQRQRCPTGAETPPPDDPPDNDDNRMLWKPLIRVGRKDPSSGKKPAKSLRCMLHAGSSDVSPGENDLRTDPIIHRYIELFMMRTPGGDCLLSSCFAALDENALGNSNALAFNQGHAGIRYGTSYSESINARCRSVRWTPKTELAWALTGPER